MVADDDRVSSVVQTSESEMEVEYEQWIPQVSKRVSSADDRIDKRTRVTRADSKRIAVGNTVSFDNRCDR
jgi:hypothetical protein